MRVKLADIKVPYKFLNNGMPKNEKIDEHWKYYRKNGKLRDVLVINKDGVLMDGYIDYLLACRIGRKMVEVKISEKEVSFKCPKNPKKQIDGCLQGKDGYYFITNGKTYLNFGEGLRKKGYSVNYVKDAYAYNSKEEAIKYLQRRKIKGNGFGVYNAITRNMEYYQGGIEAYEEMQERILSNKEKLYKNANGRCEICGEEISFEQSTIDHIMPKYLDGANDMANYQCSCRDCNRMKGHIAPEIFDSKIAEIFLHQFEKTHSTRDVQMLKLMMSV